ncbi:IGHMBP2 family helicase [Marinoscillum furvescens]|uniref:Putative DNA helicase n=1 Tax=Marinoscillum furvescens DSM 4134 TaxID=1122208 RepID=A0A3D9KWW0_MARFU|nr:IGHMBP2 family helicase [Marinoscillum furvescens]RED91751.1 putative DNA helicase [Marinoscillum furvescens DSM 4134]
MNHSEHFLHLLQLLRKEREEDRKQYESKIRNRSLEDRKKEGVTWYPVTPGRSYLGTGEKWVVQIERTIDVDKRHFFQVGASVSLFLNDPKKKLSASGIVSKVNERYMTMVLNREDPPDWMDEGRLGVDLLFDESTYDEMEKAMRRMAEVREGRLKELATILLGKQAPSFGKGYDYDHPALNKSQNRALSLIRSAKDLALVHGPPGTGKTTTLVEAIKDTVSEEKQVMVAAASNAAVDLLAEKLTQQGIRVLRMGHPARVTEEVVSTTLDARLAEHADAKMLKDLRRKAEEYRSLGRKYKRNFGRAEREQRKMLLDEARNLRDDVRMLEDHMIQDELNKAEVIACTLVGANHNYIFKRSYKTLFIDEASQALEPASWIPVMKAHRVVMAGDHWQLPPTVKSREAAQEGLAQTLFERAIMTYDADVMLDTQYRMHDAIMHFSNKKFYKGKLKSAALIAQRRAMYDRQVEFVDTAGCGFDEKLNPETLSTYNEEEAHFVLQRLEQTLQGLADEDRQRVTIGVIAPYKAQSELLRKYLAEKGWEDQLLKRISINSVDAFQGQERDIMMISLTRSNPNGEIGFLADERRMNVAMTRARHLLVMIGDSATLSTNVFFDEMIQDFQARQAYSSAFEYLYS